MSFNGSGTFSIINTFVPSTTILSAAVNQNFTDIASGLTDCLTRDGQAGMLAAFKAIAGSAGAPSISFTADPTTGLYYISANSLGLSANGALALTLTDAQVAAFAQSAYAKTFVVLDTAHASTSTNINALTTGTGTMNIGTATSWATNGYLMVGNEIMSYTVATAANTLTVNTRGDMGTTSVSHATGATITMLYTGMSKTDLLLPARATAARATAPAPGDFAFNTGSGGPEYYNGAGWVSVAPVSIAPQGYLSPTAGVPVVTADAVSQSTVYYNPYNGNLLPIPVNGIFTTLAFSTAGVALGSSQTTAGIYDIYAYASAGSVSFGVSPSWAAGNGGSVTPGSCARGTGAGGTELTRTSGLWVNTTSMTLLGVSTAAATAAIATASGLYLGSIYIGATAGTVNLHRAYGSPTRQWGVWNAYNRVPIYLKGGDATASWTYATATVRPSNGATAGANNMAIFSGLAEDIYNMMFTQECNYPNQVVASIGLGYNSTTTYSGKIGPLGNASNNSIQTDSTPLAEYISGPALGVNIISALESGNATGTHTFYGTETHMLLSARWRG